jgi:hypothetical protein
MERIVMSSWYKVTVKYEDTIPQRAGKSLQDAFLAILVSNGTPKDAALFGDRSDDFERYFYYFSPAAYRIASQLIDSHEGVPCPKPSGKRLAFLVGDEVEREGLLK